MAVISELAVAISARTEKLQAGLRRASSELKIFGLGVGQIGRAIGGGMTAAVAAGAASLAYMTKQQIGAIDSAVELGQRVGASQREIVGFGLAADIAGSSAETIANGLARMNRQLGDAAGGSKNAIKLFDSIGLSFSELIAMRPAEAFGRVADAIKALPNAAAQASAAVAIFGRGGADLLNVLQLGSEGLAKFRTEADAMGLTLNQTAADDVSAAKDSIDALGKSATGTATQLAGFFAPSIKAVADALRSLKEAALPPLNTPYDAENAAVVELLAHHRELAQLRANAGGETDDPAAPGAVAQQTEEQAKAVDGLIAAALKQNDAIMGTSAMHTAYAEAVENNATPAQLAQIEAIYEAIDANKEYQKGIENLADAQEDAAKREEDFLHKKIDAINAESRARFEANQEIADLQNEAGVNRRANESIRDLAPTALAGSAEAYRLIAARETRGPDMMTKLQQETNKILERIERQFGPAVIREF